MIKRKPIITLEELLKPQIWTCGKCGGSLIVRPYQTWDKEIKSINFCSNCSLDHPDPEEPHWNL